jgi:integrase
VRETLIGLLGPAKEDPEAFVFHEGSTDTAMSPRLFLEGLREMLIRMSAGLGASEENRPAARRKWEERNVLFHSWRHFYSARMADRVDDKKVIRATGNKSATVFQAYADHALESDLAELGIVAGEVFKNIARFPKAVGSESRYPGHS